MKFLLLLGIVFVAFSAASVYADEEGDAESHVITLDADSFEERVVGSSDVWFVKFYAPWCGHCKQLAPTWDELAASFVDNKSINIAKVDVTQQPEEFARTHGISGFPTLKSFSDGVTREYKGARALEPMAAFAKAASEPIVGIIKTGSELGELLDSNAVSVVVVLHESEDLTEQQNQWKSLAIALLDANVPLRITTDSTIHSETKENGIGTYIFKEGEKTAYDGSAVAEEAETWILANYEQSFPALGPDNFERLALDESKSILIVGTSGDVAADTTVTDIFFELSQGNLRSKFNFAHIDGHEFSPFLSRFGLTVDHLPGFVILNTVGEKFWFNEELEVSVGAITKYLNDVASGEIEASSFDEAKGSNVEEPDAGWEDYLLIARFWAEQNPIPAGGVFGFSVLLVLYCVFGGNSEPPKPNKAAKKAKEATKSKKKKSKKDD